MIKLIMMGITFTSFYQKKNQALLIPSENSANSLRVQKLRHLWKIETRLNLEFSPKFRFKN
jgi:hypothetical protein